MAKASNELTPKQQRFCQEYVIDLNGTQAAIRAGYSEKTAAQIADENLRKPQISDFIAELQQKIGERLEITADMVVRELAKIGFHNVHDFIQSGNDIRDLSLLDRDMVAPVSGIKVTEIATELSTRTTTELKFHDKVSALEKLGKHLGVFEKDNSQKATKISVKLNK